MRRLEAIRRQVVRLNQLVDQLLDVSRLIEGRLELHPEQVDLQAVVLEAIDLMRESATAGGLAGPASRHATRASSGTGIGSQVGQVVTNLLSNAIKFGCGRPIEVELDADESEAELQVRDDGEGIQPQEQERIFQRFERATSVRRHPGMGLGLWICKQIVDACHGTISVASETWPRRARSASSCRGQHERPAPAARSSTTTRSCARAPWTRCRTPATTPVVAGNGWEALAATQGPQVPQLILLDLMMPDMNGWQFREAQQRDARIKDIPLVVITASRDLVNHPIDADGVLLKPFGLNDLLGQVFKLVGHA